MSEPRYVQYFWDEHIKDGGIDDGIVTFDVLPVDRLKFPELKGIDRVYLACGQNGPQEINQYISDLKQENKRLKECYDATIKENASLKYELETIHDEDYK